MKYRIASGSALLAKGNFLHVPFAVSLKQLLSRVLTDNQESLIVITPVFVMLVDLHNVLIFQIVK